MTRLPLTLLLIGLSGGAWGQTIPSKEIPETVLVCSEGRVVARGDWTELDAESYCATSERHGPPRYTLAEINRMRAAIIKIGNKCVAVKPDEIGCEPMTQADVAAWVNVYIAAGIRPEELESKVK